MKTIAGKHAFITGGASGIGLAMARALLAEGAKVSIADFDAERLDALTEPFARFVLDVRDRDGWARVGQAAEAANGPVAILCNNAGIGPDRNELADLAPDRFDRMIAIKLTGTFNGIHCFGAGMRARGEGHIVNTASMAGLKASARLGAYVASKFGVVGLSEVLREEMAPHGVGVSVLCPGMIATDIPETLAKANGTFDPSAPKVQMPGVDPARVGLRVVEGIKGDWPYILTHGEQKGAVEARVQTLLAAFDATPPSTAL